MSSITKRAIGFNIVQRGDVIISTVAARAFKEQYPDYKLTLGIHKSLEDMLPMFGQHESFSDYHLYHGLNDWPNGDDNLFLAKNQFDIVYHGMPKRANEAIWWMTESQPQNICSVYGLTPPTNLQCSLTKWFDVPDYLDYVGFQPFGGWQDWPNKKSFSVARAQEVVEVIRSLGFNVLQFGGPDEPVLANAEKFDGTYFESMQAMLGCRALVTVDSGRIWASSAYSFPTVGLYSHDYYGPEYIKNIQPINPNAVYRTAPLVNDIPLDEIAAQIKEITS